MLSVFALSHQNPTLLVLGLALSASAIIMQLCLMMPVVFHWVYARNLHLFSMIVSLGTSFIGFIAAVMTRFMISGAMYSISTVSLQTVETIRGRLSEAFLWVGSAFWFSAFVLMWWVRCWELREAKIKANEMVLETNRRGQEHANT